jgi:hypothetical protein
MTTGSKAKGGGEYRSISHADCGNPAWCLPGVNAGARGQDGLPENRVEPLVQASCRQVASVWMRKVTHFWMRRTIGAFLLALVAGAGGYYLHAFRADSVSTLPRQGVQAMECYFAWDSFSEVEEAKSLLKAAARQFIEELRTRPVVGVFTGAVDRPSTPEAKAAGFTKAVRAMEQTIAEFKDTEEELILVKEFLWLLQREENYDRWLDVYLAALYRHPTHPLVGDFAVRALHFSQVSGRETEVWRAFQHLNNIPLDFEAKRQVSVITPTGSHWAQNAGSANKTSL